MAKKLTQSGKELPQAAGAHSEVRAKRGKRCGRLEKRGRKWYVLWMVNGKRYCRCTGTEDRDEAERIREDIIKPFTFNDDERRERALLDGVRAVEEKRLEYAEEHSKIPLDDIFREFVADAAAPDSTKDTIDEYGSKLGRFIRWAKDSAPEVQNMQDVTRDHVSAFMETISKSLSANSYNKYAIMLGCIWRTLEERGKLKLNPWDKVRRKKLNTHSRRDLTTAELRRVCGAVDGEMRTLFALGMYTGQRLGDLCLIDWCKIDLDRGWVEDLRQRKTGKHVVIPIHPVLAGILRETEEDKRTGYVMPGLAAKYKADDSAVTRTIQGVFESCGIKTQSKLDTDKGRTRVDVGFHSLRHTFVSMTLNGGAAFGQVQSMVGHSSKGVTMQYFHENRIALQKTVSALPDFTRPAGQKTESGKEDSERLNDLCQALREMDVDSVRRVYLLARKILDGVSVDSAE